MGSEQNQFNFDLAFSDHHFDEPEQQQPISTPILPNKVGFLEVKLNENEIEYKSIMVMLEGKSISLY